MIPLIDNLNADFGLVEGIPIEEALNKPIQETSREQRAASVLSGETQAAMGITFGDLIYDIVRIDPTIVEAADFARAADLSEIPSFVHFADRLSELPASTFDGNISQIQGYVAEHLVAQSLRSQGVEVEFPESSSQAGYDLIVNGTQFQVKCLSSPSGVNEHLVKYPDIPVFVNEELALAFENNDRVFPVYGMRHDEVVQATRDTIDAGDDVLDLNIPLITAAIVAGRNGYALLKQTTDGRSAAENIVLEMSTKGAGGAAGGALTGAALWGIGITAGWPALILPIFGTAAGYEVGKRTADWVKAEFLCRKEKAALQEALIAYIKAVIVVLNLMISKAATQRDWLRDRLESGSMFQKGLWKDWQRRLTDEIDYRQLQQQKLSYAVQSSGKMAGAKNLDEATLAALVVSRKAGVIIANTPRQFRELIGVHEDYRAALTRRLL
jgi:hypothetical protein